MPGVPASIAVQIQPQHADYADIRRLCATLEDIGVDVLFNWDHFFPLNGDPRRRALRVLDDARRVGGGHRARRDRRPGDLQPLPQPEPARRHGAHRRPHLSGEGRLILGIGSGWFERDFDEYGYEFGTAGGRLDALDRDLARHQGPLGAAQPAAHAGRSRSSSAVAASGRRCGSSPSTPTSGTGSATPRPSPTSTRSSTSGAPGSDATLPRSTGRPAWRPHRAGWPRRSRATPATRSRCTTSARGCSPSGCRVSGTTTSVRVLVTCVAWRGRPRPVSLTRAWPSPVAPSEPAQRSRPLPRPRRAPRTLPASPSTATTGPV